MMRCTGGDDYELLCTAPVAMPGFVRIGEMCGDGGVYLDGAQVRKGGYQHFQD